MADDICRWDVFNICDMFFACKDLIISPTLMNTLLCRSETSDFIVKSIERNVFLCWKKNTVQNEMINDINIFWHQHQLCHQLNKLLCPPPPSFAFYIVFAARLFPLIQLVSFQTLKAYRWHMFIIIFSSKK